MDRVDDAPAEEMASTSQVRIDNLPNELLISIFSFLPVKDLAWCAATCRRWLGVVSSYSHLWKNKNFTSFRRPAECADTRAVLRALPPFEGVTIDSANNFTLCVCFPHLFLSVRDLAVVQDFPTLRCQRLSTRLNVIGDIVSNRSTIDFDALQDLRIVPKWTLNVWSQREYSVDDVVRASLGAFPNLTQLSVAAESLSADDLDTMEGLSRLQTLEIACPGLEKLSFLRHCADGLVDLSLMGCSDMHPRELAALSQLRSLRGLRLSDFRFSERDLGATLAGLPQLESLQLNSCSFVRDLAVLGRCPQLRSLCVTSSLLLNPMAAVTPMGMRVHDLQIPTTLGAPAYHADGLGVLTDCLPAALRRLAQMGLNDSCVDYLRALAACPQLQHVCCKIVSGPDVPRLLLMSVHVYLVDSEEHTFDALVDMAAGGN